jgi:hypothetical protein
MNTDKQNVDMLGPFLFLVACVLMPMPINVREAGMDAARRDSFAGGGAA